VSTPAKAALGIAAALLLTGLVLGSLGGGTGGDRASGASVDDPGPDGLLAYSRLLEVSGHTVERVDEAPSTADLDPETTVALIDPGELIATDAADLRRFVEDGGRLVLGGAVNQADLERLAGSGIGGVGEATAPTLRPLVPAPELDGVAEVAGDGAPTIADAGSMLPLLGAPGAYTALVSSPGEGRLLVVPDAAPLRNRLLAEADNARFALALAGSVQRRVAFLGRVSTAPASGVSALPDEWTWTFLGLLAAGLAFIVARGRRLGPPQAPARELPPPRRRYTDAIATSLARSRDPAGATEPLRAAARDRLIRRAGLAPEPKPEELRRAALALGLEPDEADAILTPAANGREAVLAGRALARLTPTTTTEERR
jgi:hypothetical protein